MPPAAPSRATPFPEMIGAMTQCAYELGVAAAGMVKSAGDDTARFLAFSTEFRHCFFAVRMGIRLRHTGVAAPRAAARAEAPERERSDEDRQLERFREVIERPRAHRGEKMLGRQGACRFLRLAFPEQQRDGIRHGRERREEHGRGRAVLEPVYRVRALLQFAGEEAKHIQLFRRFGNAHYLAPTADLEGAGAVVEGAHE